LSHVSSAPSSTYAARQRSPRKHLTSLALVVLLHGLLWWAISSGLAQHVVRMTENTVEAVLLSEAPPPAPPPQIPQPKTPTPTPPTPVPATTTPVITTPVAPPPSAAPATPAVRVGATIQPGAHCAKPDYPSASRRLEEEGTVTLKFLIGADGRVLQADIEKTSGFNRLDEAARNALSKCQFRPGTVDGKPEQSWASIKYTWRLE
jgi:protein TonB